MEISHKQGEANGSFLAKDQSESVGEMTYHMESPLIMSIDHTEVKASERGNNVGLEILDYAVAFAWESNLKIKPVCKYVKVMFRKHADKYKDIELKQIL